MDKKWVFIEIILSIGGMQNARQTSSSEKSSAYCLLAVEHEKSANSEYNIRQSMYFLAFLCIPDKLVTFFKLVSIEYFHCH
jgi:hypothetical protein